MKCWGGNEHGQLGLGSTPRSRQRPDLLGDGWPAVDLGTGRSLLAFGTGDGYTCAILDNHRLKCWGYNAEGQLGLPALSDNRGDGLEPAGSDGHAVANPASEMGDNLPYVDPGL